MTGHERDDVAIGPIDSSLDDASPPPRRSWWPALIGAGLVAAASVGVIVITADDTDPLPPATSQDRTDPAPQPTASSTPATSTPATSTPEPGTTSPGPSDVSVLVDGGCITVTTAAGSATGCPQDGPELDQLEQRTFVADLDGPVIITSGSSDPLADLDATVDTGSFATRCGWDDLAPRVPAGGLVEVVVCNGTGVMGATTQPVDRQNGSISYFTLPTPYVPDGADLGSGTPIPGLPGALAFVARTPDAATCSLLLLPDRSAWKETCGLLDGLDPTMALVQLDPSELTEISIDSAGLVTSARALDAMAPSSGCTIESANGLLAAVPISSIVGGIGCIDDKASLTTGSVLTQQGPPDGSIWSALRSGGVWSITDNGTGIDDDVSFPVVAFDTWSGWPESTVPGFRSYWWEPIVAIPTQPTVDALADQLLGTVGTLGVDPEFPLNERLVAVQPDGLPLIVAQVDVGGDDSVAGAVIYVWLDQEFDDAGPVGWRAGEVLAGEVCARGGSAGRELCI